MQLDLLAILGRGIRQISKNGSWVPTDDFEMHDEGFKPRALRLSVDDESSNCFVGGAMLNVKAGAVLCATHSPKAVVCGYGGQSSYLTAVPDSQSDSEVLSAQLEGLIGPLREGNPEIIVWQRGRVAKSGGTNTDAELQNIFEFAVERSFTSVGIVTVFVHLMRTVTMVRTHLANPAWNHLRLQFFASEDVLYQDDTKWGPRLQAMNGSQSFLRTMFYECRGLNALLAGKY